MLYSIARELSFLSWTVQLVVVYLGPLAVFIGAGELFRGSSEVRLQVLMWLFFPIASALLALLVAKIWPRSRREGRHIWILPSVVLVWSVVDTLATSGLKAALRGFIWNVDPGAGEEMWPQITLTLPTVACCFYSLMMYCSELWCRPKR